MAYAVLQDLIDRFGEEEIVQLTDRAMPPSGVIDTARATQALTDADAMIDRYLGSRYTLPLASPPPGLTRVSCDIARYLLHDDAVTEQVQRLYDTQIKFLHGIAKGDISLGPDPTGQPAPTSGGPDFSAPARIMTGDSLAGL